MDFVERVRELCAKRGTSIRQLEIECGLGNGLIKASGERMSADRLMKISNHIGVTMEELMGESCPGYYASAETAETAQAIYESKELSLLFDAAKDASPEDLMLTYAMLTALKRKEKVDGN